MPNRFGLALTLLVFGTYVAALGGEGRVDPDLNARQSLAISERGRLEERLTLTSSLVRTLGGAIDTFYGEHGKYPGPTPDLVPTPVSYLEKFLVPDYLSEVPLTDAWCHDLWYWSNGASYVIISYGKDGKADLDYRKILSASFMVAQEVGPIRTICRGKGNDLNRDVVLYNRELCTWVEDWRWPNLRR